MRFLADQDVYRITIDALKEWGHDVVSVKDIGMTRARDEGLLAAAWNADRILITRDKDFGSLLFLKEEVGRGVIFLRGAPKTFGEVHRELKRLLKEHNEDELKRSFCVVETGRHRIRHL
ncbi:MAG: DUF5615 family PIN-like protein [Thermodesulfobacteriota bacterium]